MPRPTKCRLIRSIPGVVLFKPAGIPARTLENIILSYEELEAIRLKDLEGVDQAEAAGRMNVSRATFQRVLSSARKKVGDALVNGKAIQIQGGNYIVNDASNVSDERGNLMKIAVSTTDGISICGHLGMCSQFIIYEVNETSIVSKSMRNVDPVHGPGEHGHDQDGNGDHGDHNHGGVIGALSDVAVIITNGMGGHFAMALEAAGVKPVLTPAQDPDAAVKAYLEGTLDTSGSRCRCGQ